MRSGPNCLHHVGYAEVVIIMGMKIEVQRWITSHQLADKRVALNRSQYAQRVREQYPTDGLRLQKIQILKYIDWRITHSVAPVFQIHVSL